MHGLGSNGVHYSLSSKVTVVKLWPSLVGEVKYLLACSTVNYDHLSSLGSAFWWFGLRCFTLLPLYGLYMTCAYAGAVLTSHTSCLVIMLSGLLGCLLAQTCYLLTEDLSFLGRCAAHVMLTCGDEDLPPLSTSCSRFVGCDRRQ